MAAPPLTPPSLVRRLHPHPLFLSLPLLAVATLLSKFNALLQMPLFPSTISHFPFSITNFPPLLFSSPRKQTLRRTRLQAKTALLRGISPFPIGESLFLAHRSESLTLLALGFLFSNLVYHRTFLIVVIVHGNASLSRTQFIFYMDVDPETIRIHNRAVRVMFWDFSISS